MYKSISSEKLIKISNYKNEKDRICSAVGEFIALKVCSSKKNINLSELKISKGTYGKPFILGVKDYNYNISHSEKYVVCAISEAKVGVDIQKVVEISKDCYKLFLSDRELEQEYNIDKIIKLWAYKESYTKYLGMGLYLDFNKIHFEKDGYVYNEITYKYEKCFFFEHWVDSKYILVLTSKYKDDIEIKNITNLLNFKEL
ncbi:4'-phosphopantetheinyl transferase family protein [Clostridium beijerinckii]|nr:4'-phosphopantetheinyl transferase superfamily protein [Clostridium beijerinckii]ALB45167.2 4'-phosphopantetheinyl transferase superfamily protein [Clostridium beijerinckii NRRL B-598]